MIWPLSTICPHLNYAHPYSLFQPQSIFCSWSMSNLNFHQWIFAGPSPSNAFPQLFNSWFHLYLQYSVKTFTFSGQSSLNNQSTSPNSYFFCTLFTLLSMSYYLKLCISFSIIYGMYLTLECNYPRARILFHMSLQSIYLCPAYYKHITRAQ